MENLVWPALSFVPNLSKFALPPAYLSNMLTILVFLLRTLAWISPSVKRLASRFANTQQKENRPIYPHISLTPRTIYEKRVWMDKMSGHAPSGQDLPKDDQHSLRLASCLEQGSR